MFERGKSLMDTIWRRKTKLIGHIMRSAEVLRTTIDGRIQVGRPEEKKSGNAA